DNEVLSDPESQFYDVAGTLEDSGTLEDVEGVEEVYPLINNATAMVLPAGSEQQGTFDADSDFVYTTNLPQDTSLVSAPLTSGELPNADDEITLDTEAADRHEMSVGEDRKSVV